MIKAIIILLICSINFITAYGLETNEQYDLILKTHQLGNYKIDIESHERPFYETLPIITSDYFPYSIFELYTEVDNTSPSAIYTTSTVVKVDVVFAVGELSQSGALSSYVKSFTSQLESASHGIDAQVEQLKTSTISTSDKDSAAIFNAWYDGFADTPQSTYWTLEETRLQIKWGDEYWDRFTDNSATGYSFTDGSISFYTQSNKDLVHEHQYGVGFRLSDVYMSEGYAFSVGGTSTGYGKVALWRLDGENLPLEIDATDSRRLALSKNIPISTLASARYTIKCQGSTISIYVNDDKVISINDKNGRKSGTYGIWARHSENGIWFDDFSITTGLARSLGETIQNVNWRDGSIRFVIHATDVIPEECLVGNEADYAYTITKLLNSNAYLINLGTYTNYSELNEMIKSISQADSTEKGTFFYNYPITTAMQNSAKYIANIAKNLSKPTDWVLVNTEVLWNTEYKDTERDVPLNYGEHNGTQDQPQDTYDLTLQSTWGIPITYKYTEDKILAEKWRYRHDQYFFDHALGEANFNSVWIEDPVDVFNKTGKYRVNYKRIDNPFYDAVTNPYSTANLFHNYRYWSTNYDRLDSVGN